MQKCSGTLPSLSPSFCVYERVRVRAYVYVCVCVPPLLDRFFFLLFYSLSENKIITLQPVDTPSVCCATALEQLRSPVDSMES